jgi:hypothetical protein
VKKPLCVINVGLLTEHMHIKNSCIFNNMKQNNVIYNLNKQVIKNFL